MFIAKSFTGSNLHSTVLTGNKRQGPRQLRAGGVSPLSTGLGRGARKSMQLPDESVAYQYQSLLVPPVEEWTPAAELRAQHFLPPSLLRDLAPRLIQVRGTGGRRTRAQTGAAGNGAPGVRVHRPARRSTSMISAAKAMPASLAASWPRPRACAPRWTASSFWPTAASSLGPRARFSRRSAARTTTICPPIHAWGTPHFTSRGNNVDSDALQELLDLLQTTCVDPDLREECWGVIVINPSGAALETAAALRSFRRRGGGILRAPLRPACGS